MADHQFLLPAVEEATGFPLMKPEKGENSKRSNVFSRLFFSSTISSLSS